jgi:AraC family transcriptional regulator
MKSVKPVGQVKIVNFNGTKIAVFGHRGDPRLVGNSIRSFIEWRKQNHLPPRVSATFNILYDNPTEGAPEGYRVDICAAIDEDVVDNQFGVVCKQSLVAGALFCGISAPTIL